jgi:hypothetical protein
MLTLLIGCDAWPTVIDNRSHDQIRFQYHERSHTEWSAFFHLEGGEAQRLAREHWVQDLTGLRIEAAGHRYNFGYSALEPLRRAYSSPLLLRRLKFTPDCYVTYTGNGNISASFDQPMGLAFRNFGNGS